MTFFVRKRLALGPIRFGVSPRQRVEAIDHEPALSTGPGGEFARRSAGDGFFFGDLSRFDAPSLPTTTSAASMPFWTSLKPDGTRRRYGFLALLAFGLLFVLLGLGVIARKGAQGWVEVLLGAGMIAVPIVLTAKERNVLREKEERERAEREAVEKRRRQLLAAYTAALERVQRERSAESIAALARERRALTLSYDIWGAAARRALLLIGFDELSRRSAADVAPLLDDVARASGVTEEDTAAVKIDLYRTVLWHLLADDRVGEAQEEQLRAMRQALDAGDTDEAAAAQFRRLRGITAKSLPQVQSSAKLAFQERAVHETNGLLVTNKRLIVTVRKPIDIPLPQLNDIDVDVDENVLTIDTAVTKKPLRLQVDDPIYTAALIELASMLDARPRRWA